MGIWIEEKTAFPDEWDRIKRGVEAAGHECLAWQDRWLDHWPEARFQQRGRVFFHTSLGLAHTLAERAQNLVPGSLCDTNAFACHAWYGDFQDVLVHEDTWSRHTVRQLVERRELVDALGESFFVRPDSPLKPFAGRVVRAEELSYAALDHGFYYDDKDLPVIVAACREIGEEWRFVVVANTIISWSAYEAQTRSRKDGHQAEGAHAFATQIAVTRGLERFGAGCVLDVACINGEWRVMEFNPLSGASLYGCDIKAIASALLDDAL